MDSNVTMEKIVSLAKRRGFVFQSSEIYGGQAGAWDYGPMGVELKNRIARFWWKEMTQLHDDIVGLDAAILMHPRTWEASGHVENFTDPLVDCKKCKQRFRADMIPEENLKAKKCPECGGELTDTRKFNLMFKTHIGPVEDDSGAGTLYLRPETAQGIYVNYKNIVQSNRMASFDGCSYKPAVGRIQYGGMFSQRLSTTLFGFQAATSFVEFHTDGYQSALDAYQPSLRYFRNSSAFFYHGYANTFVLQRQVGKHLNFACMFSLLHYTNRQDIGSADRTIHGSEKSDLMFQLRWNI